MFHLHCCGSLQTTPQFCHVLGSPQHSVPSIFLTSNLNEPRGSYGWVLFLLSWLMKSVRSFHPSKINAWAMRQADSLFSLLWWQEQEDFGKEIKSLLQRISVNVSKVTNILNLIQTPTPGELRTQDNNGHLRYLVWLSVPNFDMTCTLVSLGRPRSSSVDSALLFNPMLDKKTPQRTCVIIFPMIHLLGYYKNFLFY